jgi:hypothetical protein
MNAQQQLILKYGHPSAKYVQDHCVVWDVQAGFPWFPVSHFLVNSDFKVLLVDAFTKLQDAELHTEIKTFDGCYNDRMVRGSNTLSLHSWACAIDLNAACDGMVVDPTALQRQGTWSPQFIATMKAAGLFYGGDFQVRADPMHFALLDG